MRSSCISHPERQPLLIIRAWQIVACDSNECAAALLSFFEYWHNVKLGQLDQSNKINGMAERCGEKRFADESLLQYHNQKALQKGVLGLYRRDSIREAIQLLQELDFISVHASPYAWDRTWHYLFHPDEVNSWLAKNSGQVIDLFDDRFSDDAEAVNRRTKNGKQKIEKLKTVDQVTENQRPLNKTTHKITTTTSLACGGDECLDQKIEWLIQALRIDEGYCKKLFKGLAEEIQRDLLCELLSKKSKANAIKGSAESYLAGIVRKARENRFELTDGWKVRSRLDSLIEKSAEANRDAAKADETEKSAAPPGFFQNAKKILASKCT